MSAVNDFAVLVESFKTGEVGNFVQAEPPKTSLEAFLKPGASQVSVCSIRRSTASFEAIVVDFGIGSVVARFLGLVLRRDKDAPVVVWNLPCRSQNQARSETEAACREFAANCGE